MKNINRILLTAFALVASFPVLFAQGLNGNPHAGIGDDGNPLGYKENDKGIAYSKDITGPENGNYTIHLHTFVTGNGTLEKSDLPADVVLVLDVSGSMDDEVTSYTYSGVEGTWSSSNVGRNKFFLLDGQYCEVIDYYNRLIVYVPNVGWRYLSDSGVTDTDPGAGSTFTGTLYTRSSSSEKKIVTLRRAVSAFIDLMLENDPGKPGKHNTVSIVKFADDSYYGDETATSTTATGNHKMSNYNFNSKNNYNYTEIVAGFTPVIDGGAQTLKDIVNGTNGEQGLQPGGATAADFGMKKALALIKTLYESDGITPVRQSNKTVVFFTDGDPNHLNGFDDTVANTTISDAKEIKSKLAYKDEKDNDVKVSIYSVSVFNGATPKRTTYMNNVSSNYPNASSMTDGWEEGEVTGKYYKDASEGGLEDIFRSIASEAGGNSNLNNTTITAVDVVSQSFNVPEGAGNIVFYEAPVLSIDEETGAVTFVDKDHWIPEPPGVSVVPDENDPHKITATGFDYAAKYCGFQEIKQDGVVVDKVPHGSKLVIEIRITMASDAVGGPLTDTNGPGSGIYLDGKNELLFESPKVDLPVNLQIKKVNMHVGESSKFKIQKISASSIPEGSVPSANSSWTDVSSVFVTKTSSVEEPSVWVRGLDPNFYYRILEENWGWSYNFVSASGTGYVPDVDDVDKDEDTKELIVGTKTVTNKLEVTSDKFVGNPIVFNNEEKTHIESNVHHAESKATNTFNGSDPVFVDSKKGNGTGRITP